MRIATPKTQKNNIENGAKCPLLGAVVVAPDSTAGKPRLFVPAQMAMNMLQLPAHVTMVLEGGMVTHFGDMPQRSADHNHSRDPAAYTNGVLFTPSRTKYDFFIILDDNAKTGATLVAVANMLSATAIKQGTVLAFHEHI